MVVLSITGNAAQRKRALAAKCHSKTTHPIPSIVVRATLSNHVRSFLIVLS